PRRLSETAGWLLAGCGPGVSAAVRSSTTASALNATHRNPRRFMVTLRLPTQLEEGRPDQRRDDRCQSGQVQSLLQDADAENDREDDSGLAQRGDQRHGCQR